MSVRQQDFPFHRDDGSIIESGARVGIRRYFGLQRRLGGYLDSKGHRNHTLLPEYPSVDGTIRGHASPLGRVKGLFVITIILSLIGWTDLARVVRGKLIALREEDFVLAARFVGAGHARLIFRHLIPQFTSHIIVTVTLAIPSMVLAETALSFLGIGLRPPITSLGVLLKEAQNVTTIALYPWLLIPVLLVIVTVLSFNFVGDGLRDAVDPYSR